jgi:endo-1,4-beta-xylanase
MILTRESRRVLRASRLLPALALLLSTGTAGAQASLKEAFAGDFRIGAALSPKQFDEGDAAEVALVKRQFNTITPENVLKWERVHPRPGQYDFGPSDAYVAFGTRNGMFVVGHTLVWHSQTPRWVFQDSAGKPLTRDALLARLRDHIRTVVGRYKGRIGGWDVVNEVVDEDGTLRKSPWQRIIGDDYIAKAFQFAHEADPAAQLYYNDYSLENPVKRAGAVALVKSLLAQGVSITGVGLQGHHKLDWPSAAAEDSTIAAFAALHPAADGRRGGSGRCARRSRSVHGCAPRLRAAEARRPLCGDVRRLSQAPRRDGSHHFLGRHRRRQLAQ